LPGRLPRTVQLRDGARANELLALGAERVLTGDQLDMAAFDVVLDGVGGVGLQKAIHAVRPDGTIVLFGATDPEPAKLTLRWARLVAHETA
jgi:NADPH:quinone reductase-like Zn-dependent oxidoreductase